MWKFREVAWVPRGTVGMPLNGHNAFRALSLGRCFDTVRECKDADEARLSREFLLGWEER